MSNIKTRIQNLLNVLDAKDTPYTYIFTTYDNGKTFKLMDNQDTIIDDDNYIFKGKEGVEFFITKEGERIGHKINPLFINIVDNNHLESALFNID